MHLASPDSERTNFPADLTFSKRHTRGSRLPNKESSRTEMRPLPQKVLHDPTGPFEFRLIPIPPETPTIVADDKPAETRFEQKRRRGRVTENPARKRPRPWGEQQPEGGRVSADAQELGHTRGGPFGEEEPRERPDSSWALAVRVQRKGGGRRRRPGRPGGRRKNAAGGGVEGEGG